MKLCYIVYREESVMVYDSQVLDYISMLKKRSFFESIELIIFRHEQNFFKKEEVENRINEYADKGKSFWSFPVLSIIQLMINSIRLRKYIKKTYSDTDQIAVICRGDLAAYVGTKAFSTFLNSRILYDNRGLSFEESLMSHNRSIIHILNRNTKQKALLFAKAHCDMYNFVTNPMREYLIKEYKYNPVLPYTVIPTLYNKISFDDERFRAIANKENYREGDFIVSYIGAVQAWQGTKRLIELVRTIAEKYLDVRFFILSNGVFPEISSLPQQIKERITVKSVPHKDIQYYLAMINVGIVIRDNSIVNQVAAPTKIAEYLMNGIHILYSGEIGILNDLKTKTNNLRLISIDSDPEWLAKINPDYLSQIKQDSTVTDYFLMEKRQMETCDMLLESFSNKKIL